MASNWDTSQSARSPAIDCCDISLSVCLFVARHAFDVVFIFFFPLSSRAPFHCILKRWVVFLACLRFFWFFLPFLSQLSDHNRFSVTPRIFPAILWADYFGCIYRPFWSWKNVFVLFYPIMWLLNGNPRNPFSWNHANRPWRKRTMGLGVQSLVRDFRHPHANPTRRYAKEMSQVLFRAFNQRYCLYAIWLKILILPTGGVLFEGFAGV